MKYKPLALAAAALLAGYLGLCAGARAANVMTGAAMPDIATSQDSNIQLASHHHHHHGFGSSIFLGFGFPGFYQPYYYEPYYYEPYYYQPYYGESYYYGGGSSHVRYCLSRYRTYSVRTDTFVGYDGYRHRCRSRYRY